jgi:hypothetical protein
VHDLVGLDGLRDLVPGLHHVGLLLGQDEGAVLLLHRVEVHVDLVAHLDGDLAFGSLELGDRDLALGLVRDVDRDPLVGDADDPALHDGLLADPLLSHEVLVERGELVVGELIQGEVEETRLPRLVDRGRRPEVAGVVGRGPRTTRGRAR